MPRSTFLALIATPLSIVLTFAGYPNWHGGWTVGARYLVSAVPFLALLIAFAAAPAIEALLLGASVTVIAIVSLVFPFVAPDYPAPWISFAWPMLRRGFVAPNLLHFVARPLAIAVPFALVAAAALGHLLFGDVRLDITVSLLVGSIPDVILGALSSSLVPGGLIRGALSVVLLASGLKLLGSPTTTAVTVAACLLVVLPIWMGTRRRHGIQTSPAKHGIGGTPASKAR